MKKRQISLICLSLLYLIAGINHFVNAEFYMKIMPHYFPIPLELVYISGICEIILGILMQFKKTRKVAAWLIIAMLVAFLPVHIQMVIDTYASFGILFWVAILRLPLQYVLIRWAYLLSKK
ncbi:MAG: hypothetical protein HY062_15875 [Bacteroidetes bacterium]|nr:hypothetical protein [Bacteroidota bacterium]